jgi:alpha-N-acetylglucosaminidase
MAGNRGLEILTELDRLMESHPLNRLDRWIGLARSHSSNPALQNFYESNARQIITTWGPPVNDYSCRLWSGLIRDFYHERMVKVLHSIKTGQQFDRAAWEHAWVTDSGISKIEPYADPLTTAKELVKKALSEALPDLSSL